MDLTSSSEAKFGQGQPSSPNKRKNLGTFVITRRKSWEKIPILGPNLKFRGQNSGICHLNFWRQNLGPQQEFQSQILGPSPSTSLYGSTHWGFRMGIYEDWQIHTKAAFIMYNPGGGGRFLLISCGNFKPLQTNC